eukprot:TRINITY_DN2042_c0_g2_i1.p3 TRINITY_DN2042_c0_g2~~TRINITY_DN2042_c0_g2_i1.p3  ORF type:complete len:109 (-),score=5.99 TRINITY_DN2042_c0_g2_i1:93-419(-)
MWAWRAGQAWTADTMMLCRLLCPRKTASDAGGCVRGLWPVTCLGRRERERKFMHAWAAACMAACKSGIATKQEVPVLCVDTCLLYTSDAADEEDSVDLGGCRIFEKNK